MREDAELARPRRLSALLAMGLAVSLLENMLPITFMVPGLKLGLANIVVVLALVLYGPTDALVVSLLRVLIVWSFSGLPHLLMMSFAGALFSALGMSLTWRYCRGLFSVVGVSIIGAVLHNTAQLLVAGVVLVRDLHVIGLLAPWMIVYAIPTGLFTGLAAMHVLTVLSGRLQDKPAAKRINN